MQRLYFLLLLLLAFVPPAHADKRKPKPALPAQQYPLHETHESERVTIAAEPGDTKENRPDTRCDYFHNGLLPIRVIVTNDSDEAVLLDEARIHFITADDTVIPAATTDDLQRRLFDLHQAQGTKIPLPMPLPPITIHHKPVDKKILQDDEDFGFPTTTIKPHTTVAGYLYYDMFNVDDPVLKNATLELRKVKFATSNKYLDSFEIPLTPSDGTESPPAEPTKQGVVK